MALAGSLEIQLTADVARLRQDFAQAKTTVGDFGRQVEQTMGAAKNAIAALGITIGIGAFTAMIKGAIDAADKLNDLSKSTSLTVEMLSGLGIAAKQSGSDIDSVAGSINKLSINIAKDAEKYRALGITAKEPLEAFKQLADIFNAIEDPQLRAAVAAAALGKQWAGAAPMLAEGSAKIQEMVDKGSALSGMTSEFAKQADEFNDKLVLLTGTGGTMNRIVGPLLPLLNMLADEMLELSSNTKAAEDRFNPLLETLKVLVVLGSEVAHVFRQVGTGMGGGAARIAALLTGDWQAFKTIGKELEADLLKNRENLEAWQRQVMAVGTAMDYTKMKAADLDQVSRAAASRAAADAREEAEARSKGVTARANAFLKEKKAVEDLDATYRSMLKALKDKLIADKDQTEVTKLQNALDALSVKQRATITAARERELRGLAQQVDLQNQAKAALEQEVKTQQMWLEQQQEVDEFMAAREKARGDAILAAEKNIEQIQFETRLLTMSNDEREIAIALRALETSGIDKQAQGYDALTERLVNAIKQQQAVRNELERLRKFPDEMAAAWRKAGADIGESLSKAFGSAGTAVGQMIRIYTQGMSTRILAERDFATQKAAIEKEAADDHIASDRRVAQLQAQYDQESLARTSGMYGDMAAAAAGFFDKSSGGYKTLMAVSQAFHAVELALTIANNFAKAAGAVLNQGTGDPYTAFARMAAMAAVVAALGYAVSGGGGGGGGGMSAADRQRQQGTGTVLGDAEAKSASLVNALEEIESIDRLGLVVLHDQLEAHRAIQAAMGGLATLIFRTTGLTTGEGFDVATGTSVTARPGAVGGLDRINQSIADAIGIGSIVSGILGLWGKTSTEITDSGLQIAGSVRDLIAGLGIDAYANVRTNSSSFFGLIRSSSESTETQPASDAVRRQIGMIFSGITDSVEAAAKALGIWFPAMSEHLRNFVVDVGKISFKDLKGQELEDAINAVFSSFADKLAASVMPTELIDQFQKVGEGAFETMVRLATENEVATNTLNALGLSVNAAGLAGLTARLRLVELAGGIEEFTEQTQSYFENYFSEVERHTNLGANLSAEFARMGATMPTTTEGFRQLVQGLKIGTEEGDRMFAALMSINEPFAEWANSIVGLDGQLHTIAERNEQRMDAEDRLAVLKGTKTEQQLEREREILGAIDEYNLMLIRGIHAQEDFNAAAEAATERRRDEMSLEAELAEAQGDMAKAQAIRYALETEGMNAAELASYQYTESLRHQIDVARLAADAQRTKGDLEQELFDLTHSEADILANNRRLRLAELEAQEQKAELDKGTLTNVYRQIIAQEDLNAATKASEEAAEKAAAELESFASAAGLSLSNLTSKALEEGTLGKTLGDALTQGIETALRNQAADQIAQIFYDGLITPILQSMVIGGNVAEAIAQADIETMVDRASKIADALGKVFDDPQFVAAMDKLREGMNKLGQSIAATGATASQSGVFNASYEPPFPGAIWVSSGGNFGYWAPGPNSPTAGGGTGADPQDILRQKLELLARIYELTGDKAGALAVLEQQRAMALAALDPSLRAFQTQLWALEAAAEAAAKALEFTKTKRQLEIDLQRELGNEALALEMERADLIAELTAQWGPQAQELIAIYQQIWAAQDQVASTGSEWVKTLQDWLRNLQLNDTLSPLTARQRFDFAQQQYVEDLLKAQGGDAEARARFTDNADAYLRESLAMFGRASVDYNAIFRAIEAQTQGLIAQGLGPSAPATMSDLNTTLITGQQGAREQADALIAEVRSLRTDVAILTRRVEEGNEAVHEQTDTLEGAIDNNAPATARAIVNETGGGLVS